MEGIDGCVVRKTLGVINSLIKRGCCNAFTPMRGAHYEGIVRCGLDLLRTHQWVNGALTEERIVDYVVYHIYRCRDVLAAYPDTKWRITWMWSDNAFAKFYQQYYGEDARAGINYYIDQWLAGMGQTRDSLAAIIRGGKSHPLSKYIYIASEEMTKRRWLNTEEGRLNCLSSTTGWTPFSPTCRKCRFADNCVNSFNTLLPEIIRLRQEAWRNQ